MWLKSAMCASLVSVLRVSSFACSPGNRGAVTDDFNRQTSCKLASERVLVTACAAGPYNFRSGVRSENGTHSSQKQHQEAPSSSGSNASHVCVCVCLCRHANRTNDVGSELRAMTFTWRVHDCDQSRRQRRRTQCRLIRLGVLIAFGWRCRAFVMSAHVHTYYYTPRVHTLA